jgi:hypothetical protein
VRCVCCCAAGWDIPEALAAVFRDSENDDIVDLTNKPGKWMRPAKCLKEGEKARDFFSQEEENAIWNSVRIHCRMHCVGMR